MVPILQIRASLGSVETGSSPLKTDLRYALRVPNYYSCDLDKLRKVTHLKQLLSFHVFLENHWINLIQMSDKGSHDTTKCVEKYERIDNTFFQGLSQTRVIGCGRFMSFLKNNYISLIMERSVVYFSIQLFKSFNALSAINRRSNQTA